MKKIEMNEKLREKSRVCTYKSNSISIAKCPRVPNLVFKLMLRHYRVYQMMKYATDHIIIFMNIAETMRILRKNTEKLELVFMKHYAPNRCLYIKVAKLRTGVGSAEMSHLQNRCLKISGGFFVVFFFWGGQVGGCLGGCHRVDVNKELKFL